MNFTIAKNIGIIAAVGVFLISSIYAPRVNIEDRAIVHAVGVDKAGEDYEVSLQVFSTTQSGSNTPIDPSQPNMKVISAKGKTIYEGVKNCELILGSDAFIGHNKLILFGSSLYSEELDSLLDWFRRENENYLGVAVAYAENTAKEILEAPLTEGAMAAENLEGVIKYAVDSGTTVKSDLLTLINDLSEEGGCGALPVISVIEEKNSESGSQQQEQGGSQSEQQSGKYIEIKKTAILKDKKTVGVLDPSQTAGMLWISGKMKNCTVSLKSSDSSFNVRLESKKTSRKINIKDGRVVLKVNIKADLRLMEDVSEKTRSEAVGLARERIISDCKNASEAVIETLKADGLGIMKGLRASCPGFYKQNVGNYEKILEHMIIEISVQSSLST